MEPLLESLKRIRRRLLVVRAAETGVAGAIGAAGFAAVLTIIRIFLPQHVPLVAAHPMLPLVFLPCGFAIGLLARLALGVSVRDAALAADRGADLKERLATALEVIASTTAGRREPGLLDDRLLEQARGAAAGIDPVRVPMALAIGRHTKVLAVAALVLIGGALVPAVGGPPVEPQAAERAADALERAAAEPSLAPVVRAEIERAIGRLRQSGARQGAADQATAAVYQAATQADRARRETLESLKDVDNPELKAMVRAASEGDRQGAAGAARSAAERLGSAPSAGGMTLKDRERLADGLAGAAPVARRQNLEQLAADLEAAAQAIRKADQGAAEAMRRLAGSMADTLGPSSAETAVVDAVAEARRAMGLSESSAGAPLPGTAPDAKSAAEGSAVGPAAGPSAALAPGTGQGTAAAIPPDVRPEDRDIVRRYFGDTPANTGG